MLNKPLLLVLSFVILVGLAVFQSGPAAAVIARVPAYIFKANGVPFGFVMTPLMASSGHFILGVDVAGEGNVVSLRVLTFGGNGILVFEGSSALVQYTGLNCTGTVHLWDPNASGAHALAVGKVYAVGPDPANGGTTTIFRAVGAAIADPGIQSRFNNGACTNNGVLFDVGPAATPIQVIPNGPYTLE